MKNTQRATLTELEISSLLVEDICVEPGCGTTILVDREDKLAGRQSRCTACIMRSKLIDKEEK